MQRFRIFLVRWANSSDVLGLHDQSDAVPGNEMTRQARHWPIIAGVWFRLRKHTAAVLLVLKAAGPEASVKAPIIVFVLRIILSAYVGGLAPGLVSTMLAVHLLYPASDE
jgi:hypothetical protein